MDTLLAPPLKKFLRAPLRIHTSTPNWSRAPPLKRQSFYRSTSPPKPPRGGAGGTMTPGSMEFRGPDELERGPIQMTLRSEGPSKSHVKSFMSFADHLILAGKTVKISVKTFFFFFFWRSHHFSDQTAAFSSSMLDFTKPEFRHI